MSTSVNQKVVSIKFDNAQFESKLTSTMAMLDKLKTHLDFSGSTRSMGDLSAASSRFDLGSMGTKIEGVGTKFLALATIGITALTRLTNAAITSASQIAKQFTTGPIKDGFKEYETNLNSIQTILSNTDSKGSTLKDVNKSLQELNTYSDQTIYNFSEMARNIGTFTAAGVDLKTSTASIKGIANLAALSGSNSEQASTAMYQLSQAIASGSVKLQDWNSVVNAGMGGEIFQKALFESGKAMKSIKGIDAGTTFKDWAKEAGGFRNTLKSGWITTEVLTKTLKGFTGDLTEAQIVQMGYTKKQAAELLRLGKIGKAAATTVKTVTQLVGTVKESIGSGWGITFQTVIGDFEESKKLFTDLNTYIGDFVGRQADARNKMLQTWKDFGGRDVLIQALKDAFKGLLTIIKPIKDALHDIFPPTTAADLIKITAGFASFAKKIAISGETAAKIKSIFSGVFSVIRIGAEVVKQLFLFLKNLVSAIIPAGHGALTFAGHLGDIATAANYVLVKGEGIKKFFDKITMYIFGAANAAKKWVQQSTEIPRIWHIIMNGIDSIKEFVKSFSGITFGMEILERLRERWGWLITGINKAINFVKSNVHYIGDVFEFIGDVIHRSLEVAGNALRDFKEALGKVFDSKDFNGYLDLLNVGLIAGILLAVKSMGKTLKKGLKLDIGNGLFEKLKDSSKAVTRSFDSLTNTMKAMQTQIKAKALKEIAIAIAVLTGSVLILSLMDSGALTKSLTAIAVGMGQLMAAMALMDKMSVSGAKMMALGAALILLAGAIFILSLAMKIMSTMDPAELAKGLSGVASGLTILIVATKNISKNADGLIRAGIAMIAISLALVILALAVKAFSMMSWAEIGKGLASVAVGLHLLARAANAMPKKGMVQQGAGLILLALGLKILAQAVKSFGDMSWKVMGKGLLAMAGALLVITLALRAMPKNMVAIGTGLILVSVSLKIMASAIATLGSMNLGDLIQGIAAMGITLGILAIAAKAMQSALPGAIAIGIIATSLFVLAQVIQILGKMSISELATALGAIAAGFIVIGLAAVGASYITGPLFILAAALIAIGIGAAVFGVGAFLIATAFVMVVKAGRGGIAIFKELLAVIVDVLPKMAQALADGLINMAIEILKRGPTLIKYAEKMIAALIEALIRLVPRLGELLGALFETLMQFLQEKIPEFAMMGIKVLVALLTGIRDNIYQVASLVVEILVNFVNAIAANIQPVIAAGVNLILQFVSGIISQLYLITAKATELVNAFVNCIIALQYMIVAAGVRMLMSMIFGIASAINQIVTKAVDIVIALVNSLAANANRLVTAGANAIISFITGISNNVQKVIDKGADILIKFIEGIGGAVGRVVTKGADVVIKFIEGVGSNALKIIKKGADVIIKFVEGLGSESIRIIKAALAALLKFLDGLQKAIEDNEWRIIKKGVLIAAAIAKGMVKGLVDSLKGVVNAAIDLAKKAIDGVKKFLHIGSPSRVFMEIGGHIGSGLALGINRDTSAEQASTNLAKRTSTAFENSLRNLSAKMIYLDDISPTISPILDLTRVEMEARRLSGMMGVSPIVPEVSYDQARHISHTTDQPSGEIAPVVSSGSRDVKFEQHIHSPSALSTADIYRNTKSQIALAKEELSI